MCFKNYKEYSPYFFFSYEIRAFCFSLIRLENEIIYRSYYKGGVDSREFFKVNFKSTGIFKDNLYNFCIVTSQRVN